MRKVFFKGIGLLSFLFFPLCVFATLHLGVDQLFEEGYDQKLLKGKKVGLITNHTGVNRFLEPTASLFLKKGYLKALFSPEHGLSGEAYAFEKVASQKKGTIPVYSLHGKTRRPTPGMLRGLDLLVFDIQDIGVRSYTYISTLFYAMESAAKHKVPFIVLDRPNPMGGLTVDGPMLLKSHRSYIGYINVPYCHGMTVGELAHFFNQEYKVGCELVVIPMKGWHRGMTFEETGLSWIPTSPHIPRSDTPLFYASTGILGELSLVSIGVGYTLPFQLVGAPWIDRDAFAKKLNRYGLKGVHFLPYTFRPFYGAYRGKNCGGVLVQILDKKLYQPHKVQCLILGLLKEMYPNEVVSRLKKIDQTKKGLFSKAMGSDQELSLFTNEARPLKKLMKGRGGTESFLKKRKKYLCPFYASPKKTN